MPSLNIHSPLHDAVAQMAARTVAASPMLSREWARLPAEVRLRNMFSARVEHERTLQEMKDRLHASIANAKRDGATMDKSRFVEEMRAIIQESGYRRPDGVGKKSLQNLKSRARLELIWKMNVAQARGYARWLSDMTPEGLENEPCYELIRVMQRTEVRDWPTIWENFGGAFYGGPNPDYPGERRMIAPKTSPIWAAISRFGTPWPPFDWGSGMGLSGIDIDEAEALGAIPPGAAAQEPLVEPFNSRVSASVAGIPPQRVAAVVEDFSGDVELRDGRLFILPPPAPPPEWRLPPPPPALAAAQDKALAAAKALPEEAAGKILAAIAKTTAAQRLGVDAAAAGAPLSAAERLGQALIQFFAMTSGLGAVIREARAEAMRDAWWGAADFSGVFSSIAEWLGGEA